tara:strand:+ start:618 stop:758 length:141 start_codon:yes stop_codon:yes gene_type:complete
MSSKKNLYPKGLILENRVFWEALSPPSGKGLALPKGDQKRKRFADS